ncbi:ORF3 [White spot syndrome virus]|uniref:ORF3 n=1 Tax=White spot syndrome virus TaxID=342409 RepID=A0A2D3I725_9VIRU|nr:ORF3 [White spot syndrome virus]
MTYLTFLLYNECLGDWKSLAILSLNGKHAPITGAISYALGLLVFSWSYILDTIDKNGMFV